MYSFVRLVTFLALSLIYSVGWAFPSIEAAKEEREVAFYGVLSADHFSKIRQAFNKKYPFIEVGHFRGNNERILSKALTETRGGVYNVDVFNTDGMTGYFLKEKGLLQPYKTDAADAFPKQFIDPEDSILCCTTVLTNIIGVNTDLVSKDQRPAKYEDLLNPRLRGGNIAVDADEVEWFAAQLELMGRERGLKFFRAIAKQDPIIRRGHTLQTQLLAAGEYPIALNLFGYRVEGMRAKGASIDLIQVEPVVVRGQYLLMAKRAPHPNAAALFIDFILSKEGQQILAATGRTIVRPDVKVKYPRLTQDVKLYLANPKLGKKRKEYDQLWREIFPQ
jgi:iron(III) transport system substrate-binding protein